MMIPIFFSALIFVCLWQSDSSAAMFAEDVPVLHWVIYVFIGVAAIIGILAIVNNKLLTGILGRLGHSSGDERGPRPGDGAVIHHSSGEADFDGTPGNMPSPAKDPHQDLPYPPKRAAD